jgi:hypothetical protein
LIGGGKTRKEASQTDMKLPLAEQIRQLLLELGDHVRNTLQSRVKGSEDSAELSSVSRQSAADTIYGIDRVSEEAITDWFALNWPRTIQVELVMEGIDREHPVTLPAGISPEQTVAKIILDPIDGTRGLMYDKRAAWFLAGGCAATR